MLFYNRFEACRKIYVLPILIMLLNEIYEIQQETHVRRLRYNFNEDKTLQKRLIMRETFTMQFTLPLNFHQPQHCRLN